MTIEVANHHPDQAFDLEGLAARVRAALPACLARPGPHPAPLAELEEIEISLVDDQTIDRVHREFMNVPGATDVITFHHGEILISLDTARRQAAEAGEVFEREVLRYSVHGLLHLNGHADEAPGERAAMHALQEAVLEDLFGGRA
jgi:probable rRNA maturation factor